MKKILAGIVQVTEQNHDPQIRETSEVSLMAVAAFCSEAHSCHSAWS